jgi:ornithine--oxo-acid transaminase
MENKPTGASVLTHVEGGSGLVQQVRGKGMLNALVVDPDAEEGQTAKDICHALMKNGLLAKPTHEHIIRFAPPLVMSDEQLEECGDIIVDTIKSFM